MAARHKSRQRALQVLFLWDQGRQPIDDAIRVFYATLGSEEDVPEPTPEDAFMEMLARARKLASLINEFPPNRKIGDWNECRPLIAIFCAWRYLRCRLLTPAVKAWILALSDTVHAASTEKLSDEAVDWISRTSVRVPGTKESKNETVPRPLRFLKERGEAF